MTATAPVRLPTLENGDRMGREEFHRRYALRPDLHRVELIEGTVYVPSPLNAEDHAEPQHLVQMWLGAFALKHPEIRAHGPATVFLDDANEPEPDAILYRVERGIRGVDGYLRGAPDLVVEIANSSVSRDLHQKLEAYERNGVGEYIVWRVADGAIDWFVLRHGRFARNEAGMGGFLVSTQFLGLRLDIEAALDGDIERVIAGLA